MNLIPDSTFDDTQGLDILRDFEHVWLEVGAADTNQASEVESDSIWLECDSELVDAASVKVIGARKSSCGFETVVFICPHCNEPHESLRFR
jgi:hypothetical protein